MYLVLAQKHTMENFLNKKEARTFSWIYLGENVTNAIRIEKEKPNWTRISIANLLQETAKKIANEYVEYISGITKKKDISWWASRISEKNPFISKAFLHLCYLKVAAELITNGEEMIFFVEDMDVFESIKTNFGKMMTVNITIIDRITGMCSLIKKFIINKIWFFISNIQQEIISKKLIGNRINNHEKYTIMHTFVNKNSFDNNGNFKETYFGEMPNWLSSHGKQVVILIRVLDSVAYKTIANKLAKNNNILLWNRYITVYDLLKVFIDNVLQFPKIKRYHFENLEISSIIINDELNDWIENRRCSDMLLYYGIKNMKKNGIHISEFVHTYENHAWEKISICALRKFYPETKIIGYQHAAFSNMQLNYFFTKKDLETMYLPDKIITSGKYYQDIFSEAGYPKKMLVMGGSFRFSYLLTQRKKPGNANGILVTFTLDENQATELYHEVFEAFKDENTEVILKFHPFASPKKVINAISTEIPKNFNLNNNKISELFEKCNVLIYTTSTTCIEAIAAGIVPIHLESNHFIDMDQLAEYPEARLVAKNSMELIMSIKKTKEIDTNKMEIVKERFSEINKEKIIALFE